MDTKRRLNAGLRMSLRALFIEHVRIPPSAREAELYREAEPIVRAAVAQKFPPADMEICAKYGKASVDDCIKLMLCTGVVILFRFAPKTGPVVASHTYNDQIYAVPDASHSEILDEWFHLYEERNKQQASSIDAFTAFVHQARTFGDVLNLWPGAQDFFSDDGDQKAVYDPRGLYVIRAAVALATKKD